MAVRRMRILLVEDDEDDYVLIHDLLSEIETAQYDLRWVATYGAARKALAQGDLDAALVDYRLGERDGIELVREAIAEGCRVPIVLLTGQGGYQVDAAAMEAGAADYLVKDGIDAPLLERTLRYAIALKASQERYRSLFDRVPVGLYRITPDGQILDANPALVQMLGYADAESLTARNAADLYVNADDRRQKQALVEREGVVRGFEMQLRRCDGTITWVRDTLRAVRDAEGQTLYYEGALEDVTEQLRAVLERLRLAEENRRRALQIQRILGVVPEGILLLDAGLRILVVNPAARNSLRTLTDSRWGEPLARLGGRPISELLALPPPGRWHEIVTEDPVPQAFELIARPMEGEPGLGGWVVVLRDVTKERQIDEQTRQQERLTAIGRLAGGIAHDFNNMLTVVQGSVGLFIERFATDDPPDWPPGPEVRADLERVMEATDRASGLIRQIMAFSRKQVLQPRVLDLNALVGGFEKMLRPLIGEDVEMITFLAPELGRVMADPGQVEQVIMNLAVNARDAMPGGGQLILETANVALDESYVQTHLETQPGRYVMLAVSDTGVGMDKKVLSHLFEPFFTTKDAGKGTGLGLATVHGIVKQSGGHIEVYSEPGMGTTFKVYLPRVEKEANVVLREQASVVLLQGTETILLVEDEETVRGIACRVLDGCGYTVLEAGHPEEALFLVREHTGRIDLLLTDVVMPGMNGRYLADRLMASRPEMKVLYISGYTYNAIVHYGVLDADTPFLQKPFTPAILSRKVREVLGASLSQSQADLDVQSLRAGDEIPETPAPETAGAVSLTHESVAGLPADLVAAMREATINADVDRLNELIDRVETRDAPVAGGLRVLADRYEYDKLSDLLDKGGREG